MRPSGSVASFSDPAALRPDVTLDLPGTYEATVEFLDANGGVAAQAVVSFGSDNLAPVARARLRGMPGDDTLLTLDGSASFDVEGDALTYLWGIVTAPAGSTATIADPQAALSGATLSTPGDYTFSLTVQDAVGNLSATSTVDVTVTGGATGLDLQNSLSTFNLITEGYFGNQEVEGRTYIDSYIESVTGQFGYAPAQDGLPYAEMYINGDLRNSTINLTPGDELRISGVQSNSNVNNGTLVENATDLPPFNFQAFRDTAAFLATLTGAPADVSDQNNKKFGGAPNAIAAEAIFGARTRVVQTHMNDLKTGGYSIDLNGTDTVLINVAGKFGDFQMNPLGGTGYAGRVIWNFYEATSIKVNTPIVGHVLAPYAWMSGFAGSSEGTVIALNVQLSNGELHQQPWLGVVPQPLGSATSGAAQSGPVADLGFDQLVATVGEAVVLDPFASSDINGDVLTPSAFIAVQPAGSTPSLSTDADGLATFSADTAGDYLVALDVSDANRSDQDQVLIVVGPDATARPVARIGDVTSAPLNARLVLDGSQSYNLDGALISHTWILLSAPVGSAAALEVERTGFVALAPDVAGDYIVQLQVADDATAGVPDTILVRVEDTLPLAQAGPDLLAGQTGTVPLDGSLSSRSAALSYAWSGIGLNGDGGVVSLNEAGLVMPEVSFDLRTGRFRDVISQASVYHLKRSDRGGLCQFDTRLPADLRGTNASEQIKIKLRNRGKRTDNGTTFQVWEIENKKSHTRQVTLEDAAGNAYGSFVVPGKTSVHVTTPDIGTTKLNAQVDGVTRASARYKNKPFNRNNPVCTGIGSGVVQLIVADGSVPSLPDTVFVGNSNIRPVLVAGPKFEALAEATVNFDAALYGTDANGDALSYGWSLIARPAGSSAALAAPVTDGPLLDFVPDRAGVYLLQVTANDGAMIAVPAVIEVEVINSAPVATISGDAQAFVGETATLDGSASFDPDGDALSFEWVLVSAPQDSVAILASSDQPIMSFVPDRRGDYVFSLVVSDGLLDSPAATWTLTAPNRAPVAALTGSAEIDLNAEEIYSAAASSDPDNDPLTFSYAILAQPAGADPFLSDLGNAQVGFIADLAGDYTLEVTVSDGLLSNIQTFEVTALAGNAAPVLGPLNASYTVELGLELALDLTGVDPDGDAVTFYATPLPLASGITLQATNGQVRFRPEAGQVGSYSFTVGVSDGTLTDEAVLNIEVVEADFGDTAIFGRVLDARDFANGTITPVSNVPVRLRDAALMTSTSVDGTFDFGSLAAGSDLVLVEPSAAGGPGGYLSTLRAISITENQNRDLAPDFLLVPLDDGCAAIVAGVDTVLSGTVSGVNVSIPADSVQDTAGDPYAGQICLGSLPDMFDHPGFDEDTQACRIYALDAPGAVFTQPISVVGPNLDNLPEATRLELWRVNDLNGRFRRISPAGVDTGGATVSATLSDVNQSALFTFLPQSPRTVASGDMPNGVRMLTPFEGDNATTYTLPGYTAFGQSQLVGLTYHSQAANPSVIISGDVTIAADASLPVTLSTRLDLGGLSVNDTNQWTPRIAADGTTPALVGEAVTLRQSVPFDGSGIASGRYDAQFVARAQYDCSIVSAGHSAEIYVQNETDSPYGSGWSIDGLQELVVNPDGTVAIIDDDSVTPFDPLNDFTEFDDEPLVLPGFGVEDLMVADFDGNGTTDIVFPNSGSGSLSVALNAGGRDISIVNEVAVSEPSDVPDTGRYFPNLLAAVGVDYTNDGILDVVHSSQTSQQFGVAEGDGFGNFVNENLTNDRPSDFALVDLDGDGFEDIVTPGRTGFFVIRSNVTVYFGSADGFDQEVVATFDFGVSSQVGGVQIEVSDIDQDGRLDVAVRSRRGVNIAFNNGDRNFTRDVSDLGEGGENLLGEFAKFADLDGDGLQDMIWSAQNQFDFYKNVDGRSFAAPVALQRPVATATAAPIALFDVNRDGILDILVSGNDDDASVLTQTLFVLPGVGDGTFEPSVSTDFNHGIRQLVVIDVDGDGGLDLVSSQRFSVTVDFSKPSDDGRYVSGNGDFSTLAALPGGGWERRYKDGSTVIFNEDGRQTAEVDTYGQRRDYAYDALGRLATITDQVGGQTVFAYAADGLLQSITYPDGRITEFNYSALAQLSNVEEPTGSQVSFAYDENNRLISTTNQNGNATLYTYDGVGNMSGATLPDGSNINNQVAASLGLTDGLGGLAAQPLTYVAPEDRTTTVTDRKGEITQVVVNEFGSIIQTTDPLGRVTTMTRNDQNLVTRIERPSDVAPGGVRVDEITYDNLANVLSMTEAVGTPAERSMSYVYEPEFNNVVSMIDGDGFETTYVYDAFGGLLSTIDPEGGTEAKVYTAEGKLASRTDKNGNLTAFDYNADQNLNSVTYADGSVTQMTYDATGNTTMIAEAAGTAIERQVQRTYDSLNRVLTVEVTGADGAQIDGVTQYSYLPAGNLATVTDETGLITSMGYDGLERLVALDDPAEGLIRRTYNAAGEVTEHINGDDEIHAYAYDSVSRLTQTTDPEGFVKSFSYDTRDNIQTVTDGGGGVTTFGYDTRDRMTTRTNPIGQTMARSYDARDNLGTLTREDGTVETASYDGLSRRTQVVTPDNTLTYAYDARGNLTEAADDDSRVTFTYDLRNRLETTTTDGTVGPQPQVTLSYTYDELDRRLTMSDSLGGTTSYAYDPEDRLTDLTAPWGTVYSFGYDGEGRRTSLTSTSGRVSNYGYTNGLLTALNHAQSGVALTDLAYEYDVDGQLTAILDAIDPEKSKFINYDDLNRLVQVDEGIPPIAGGTPLPVEDYVYDEEGNRTASHLSAIYASNDHNQLLEDEDFTYAYDAKGNRVSKTAKGGGAVETYTYNSHNQLIAYNSPNTTAAYAFDALDRRISKTVDGTQIAYIYDSGSNNPLAHEDILLEFDTAGSPVLTRRWTHSLSVDEPIGFEDYAESSGAGSGAERAMFADRQGSVLWIAEPAGRAVVAAYEYDGFGAITQTQGTLAQPYGYTGREFDAESGLYHYRARAYDPSGGFFLQADPINFEGGQFSLYQYVASNPFGATDPEGLMSTVEMSQGMVLQQAESMHANTRMFAGIAGLAGSTARYLLEMKLFTGGIKPSSIPADYGICSPATTAWFDSMKTHNIGSCGKGKASIGPNLILMGKIQKDVWVRTLELSMCYSGGARGDKTHPAHIGILFKKQDNCRKRIRNAMASAK
ncbi:collagen-binding domain-containing protein [Sulfitobacter sp. HNIBRBA2951]|uniref:PKD domain-containing protein n=1 Tax=Sulfitobacter aquimarinus TaxID=3158557 RepID=UPI0032E00DD2